VTRRRAAAGFDVAYRLVVALVTPVVGWWGRVVVAGLHNLPESGPVVVVANHDSHWDPLVIAFAGRQRRQFHALAKRSLWRNRLLGAFLDRMGQIPIERGAGDVHALDTAVAHLRDGECVGIFPEGTISYGESQRVRSGAARVAAAVPSAAIVGVAVTGSVDIVRFPKRPRLCVEFLPPVKAGADAAATVADVMTKVRAVAPPAPAGRRLGKRRPRRR
jgi:1-acyl-sn-glycerol-3-phosphate acyltransferase